MCNLAPLPMSSAGALVIAVANQKGGVGKTTTSVNLAASLATAERSTLLVDVDPQANASSGVGVRPRSVEIGLYDALIGRTSLSDVTLETEIQALQVVPSTQDLVGIDLELVDAEDRAMRLRRCLEEARAKYQYILLDCPPSLGLLTVTALSAADQVLVPMQDTRSSRPRGRSATTKASSRTCLTKESTALPGGRPTAIMF